MNSKWTRFQTECAAYIYLNKSMAVFFFSAVVVNCRECNHTAHSIWPLTASNRHHRNCLAVGMVKLVNFHDEMSLHWLFLFSSLLFMNLMKSGWRAKNTICWTNGCLFSALIELASVQLTSFSLMTLQYTRIWIHLEITIQAFCGFRFYLSIVNWCRIHLEMKL